MAINYRKAFYVVFKVVVSILNNHQQWSSSSTLATIHFDLNFQLWPLNFQLWPPVHFGHYSLLWPLSQNIPKLIMKFHNSGICWIAGNSLRNTLVKKEYYIYFPCISTMINTNPMLKFKLFGICNSEIFGGIWTGAVLNTFLLCKNKKSVLNFYYLLV